MAQKHTIKKLMIDCQVNNIDLAKVLGVSNNYASMLVNEHRTLTVEQIKTLGQFFADRLTNQQYSQEQKHCLINDFLHVSLEAFLEFKGLADLVTTYPDLTKKFQIKLKEQK